MICLAYENLGLGLDIAAYNNGEPFETRFDLIMSWRPNALCSWTWLLINQFSNWRSNWNNLIYLTQTCDSKCNTFWNSFHFIFSCTRETKEIVWYHGFLNSENRAINSSLHSHFISSLRPFVAWSRIAVSRTHKTVANVVYDICWRNGQILRSI